jgi:hypothetical protein
MINSQKEIAMIKSEISREHLKNYKDTALINVRRDTDVTEASAVLDLLPAVKLLHAIYLDSMNQAAKITRHINYSRNYKLCFLYKAN